MARNSADVFDHERANNSDDDREVAEALAAIDESWQDESERTDVIRPSHLMPRVLAPIEPELERLATSSLPQPPLRAAEDPGWDDDREQTFAVDFDRLAPWHVPELTPPAFEEEKTAYFERTADFELLDARFVAEYTDRLQAVPAARLPLVQVVPRGESERERQADLRSLETGAAASDDLGFAATAWHADFHDAQQEWAVSNYVPSEEETAAGSPSARAARLSRAPKGKNGKRANGTSPVARGRSSAESTRPSAAPVRRNAHARASAARAPVPVPAATTASLRPARPSQAPARVSQAPARPSQAPARVSQTPARPSQAPARVSQAPARLSQAPARLSQAPVRPSQVPAAAFASNHPATLPLAAAYDSDLAELRPNRGRASTWIWYSASAVAGVALVLAVRAWSSGGFELAQTSQPTAASETTVSAAQQQAETGFAITSQPEGAQIYVDGRATGFITPGRVRLLSPGLHSVELKLNGFYDTSLPAVLRDGSMLELAAVQMREHTPEAPALTSSTGGQAPLVTVLPPRVSRRSARHGESRRARRRSISRNAPMPTLDAGEPAQVVEVAAPGEGVLRINSRPWSRVFIDDKFVGNTPQRALHVAAGQHDVRLVNEQMSMSKKFRVVVRDGETLTRVEMLTDDAEEQRSNIGKSGSSALASLDGRQ